MVRKQGWIVLWLLCAGITGLHAQDRRANDSSRIEIENERVIVRRNLQLAHAVTPMHSHRAGVVVYLTDVRERSTAPDGTSKFVTHKAGEVVWAPARQHALENLGDAPIEAIEVELK
jgi:hypothetical protein